MFVTFLRSSSVGTYEWCPRQYFIQYVLGRPNKTQKKAEMGTIVHKALELLAQKKWAEQKGETELTNDELGRTFPLAFICPDTALTLAFDHYVNKQGNELTYTFEDFQTVKKWLNTVLTTCYGIYNPLFREVVAPELYFDIEIKREWAKYSYNIEGQLIEGYLRIKGTLDLVTKVGDNPLILEYVDWKTGQRKMWDENRPKEFEDFLEDKQLCLYYYALCHLFPEAADILVTIYYVRDGGPFTLPFSKDRLPQIEEKMRGWFEAIKEDQNPGHVWFDWKCKLCKFSEKGDSGRPVCHEVGNEIVKVGIDRVTSKWADKSKWGQYGEGGGRTQ